MQRILEYTLFFVLMLLLQLFLFNNVNLSVYINPLVYITFILLLPMEIPALALLLLGLLTGVSMDLIMGSAGINTIASLLTAYIRPMVLTLIIGKEDVRDGGIPGSSRLGTGRFLKYTAVAVFFHCLVFFSFEALSARYYHLTLLRTLLSTALIVLLIYFAQMLLPGSGKKRQNP